MCQDNNTEQNVLFTDTSLQVCSWVDRPHNLSSYEETIKKQKEEIAKLKDNVAYLKGVVNVEVPALKREMAALQKAALQKAAK